MSARWARSVAVGSAALTATALALQLYGLVFLGRTDRSWDLVTIAVGFTVIGVLVHRSAPGNRLAVLILAMGAVAAVAAAASAESLVGALGVQISFALNWLCYAPLTVVVLLLPDGRLVSPRWTPALAVAWVGVALPTVAATLLVIVNPNAAHDLDRSTPVLRALLVVGVVGFVAAGVSLLLGLLSLVVRARRAPPDSRALLRLLLLVGLTPILGLLLDIGQVPEAYLIGVVVPPLVMLVAAVRYRLLDMDLIVDRTLVWLGSTTAVLVVFLGLLWLASTIINGASPQVVAPVVLTTVATAAVLGPIRGRVDHVVYRALYGRRDDPADAFAAVDERLESSDPADVLQAAVDAIAESLALPYVALRVYDEGGDAHLAQYGRPAGAPEQLVLVHRGRRIGDVEVTARSRRERLATRERALVILLARNAAVTVHVLQLADTVQAARERLVHAGERERVRIRNDLHDGVAATLNGARFVVRSLVRDPASAAGDPDVLRQLDDAVTSSIAEVRNVVENLRPPILEAGLRAAVHEAVHRIGSAGLAVEVDAEPVDPLPPAVETAVYRILSEALTNVTRHAQAGRCSVSLRRANSGLALTVLDDGRGFAAETTHGGGGVGLESMRTRAEELGGTFRIASGAEGSTRVDVWLPTRSMTPHDTNGHDLGRP